MTFIPWSPEDDERLRELALSGASLIEIAAQMGRNKASVRHRAQKLNIAIARDRNPKQALGKTSSRSGTEGENERTPFGAGPWKSEEDDQLRALAGSGDSSSKI